MDSLFSGIESDEYKKAVADFISSMDDVDTLLETADKFTKEANDSFDFCAWLAKYLETQNKSSAFLKDFGAYAYAIYSTDTTNTDYMNNLSRVEEMGIRANLQELKFSSLLLAHQTYLDEFYTRFPEYADYKCILAEVLEDTKHQMSPAEEKLAAELNRTGGGAWGQLQEQLISNMHDENGKTFNEIRNDAYEADPLVRKNAWKKEIELLEQNRIAFAAALNNLKGETVCLNKKRHWESAIDRSLAACRLSRKSLDALIGTLEDALPMWRSYYKAKAKILAKAKATVSEYKDGDGIAFYDLFAPLADPKGETKKDSDFTKKWTFGEAKEYILKEYGSFSEDMKSFAAYAFEHDWIDAEVRAGKVGGAYDVDFAKNHESRILSNYTGDIGGIITLAHELGHAYHFSCLKGKPVMFFEYPMTLAETASTFAETIVKQDMIKGAEGFERMQIIDLDLLDASQVLVDILCRFYFERSVFEERSKGELNADDFCRLMAEAQEKSYGEGLNAERHEYMWAVKGHYYSSGLDFYNFPYAFGQLFAAGLYQRSLKEGKEFAATYKELLSNTGNMSCEDVCAKAGFDITSKDFWKSGVEMYAKEVKLFTDYADSL